MHTHTLTKGIYYSEPVAETDRPLLGLVAGSEGAIVVDAGTSPSHAREFLTAVEELTGTPFAARTGGGDCGDGGSGDCKSDKSDGDGGKDRGVKNGGEAARVGAASRDEIPIQRQFITHWHWDHIFGMQTIGATSLAHELTAGKISQLRGLAWDDEGLDQLVETGFLPKFAADCLKTEMPSPMQRQLIPIDRTFHSAGEIDLGGITCIFEHLGGSHTDDSSILYVPERGTLFLGDCVYGRRYNGAYGYRLESLVPMRDRLKRFEATHYLISHEAIHSAAELFGYLDPLIEIGELVGETADYQAAADRCCRQYGASPDEETSQMIRFFTDPNAALAR